MSEIKKPTADELKTILANHRVWLVSRWTDAPKGARADLSSANLDGADLRRADLRSADLRSANLRSANLYGADLSSANLRSANLYGANLDGANLTNAVLPPLLIVPEEGSFIGWKKVISKGEYAVLKLEIPAEAMRVNSTGRKCRASKVRVLAAFNVDGSPTTATTFTSTHDRDFGYQVGEVAEVPDANPDFREECTRGIHFFITRKEAEEY
jgi:hypothetical protein